MGITARVFLSFFLILAVPLGLFGYAIATHVKQEYRKAFEEPLVDLSRAFASLVRQDPTSGALSTEQIDSSLLQLQLNALPAQIYDYAKTGTELIVYVTDDKGQVLFHSQDPTQRGKNYSQWNDVARALRGQSGARTTRLPYDPDTSALYISTPLTENGKVIGVVSVGKSAAAVNRFVDSAKRRIYWLGGTMLVLCSMLAWVLGRSIVVPLESVSRFARELMLGVKAVPPPHTTLKEAQLLGQTIQQLHGKLEGKNYIEQYVQTLTHELKTPIFAIQGAAEILERELAGGKGEMFVKTISIESERLEATVEQLLLLSALERGALEEPALVNLSELLSARIAATGDACSLKGLGVKGELDSSLVAHLPTEPLRHAIDNLLKNALDFAKPNSLICVSCQRLDGRMEIAIENEGPQIPDYALGRIFERFYSLPRPDTQRKSSGLGLAIAAEALRLIGGSLHVENNGRGVVAKIIIDSDDAAERKLD